MRNRTQSRRTAAREDELIARHYQEVENIYRQMRAWRHDYHNHMQVIKAHLALGQTEALAQYCGQLEQELQSIDPLVKTGHILLDAILNSKLSLAKSRGIAVSVKASAPAGLAIKDVDLCVLMGNLLDNAMEACRPAQAPFIRLYMGMKGRQLYLCVTNTVFGRVKKAGGRFLSAKGPSHGFGLAKIDRICERYGGYCSRNSEEGAFTTEILLPVGPEEEGVLQ